MWACSPEWDCCFDWRFDNLSGIHLQTDVTWVVSHQLMNDDDDDDNDDGVSRDYEDYDN